MNKKENPSVFPLGNPLPEMFSKYFIGQAYLQPLTDKGGPIANVILRRVAGTTGTFITREGKFSLWSTERAGIRRGVKNPRS